jgi:hypothetical protein
VNLNLFPPSTRANLKYRYERVFNLEKAIGNFLDDTASLIPDILPDIIVDDHTVCSKITASFYKHILVNDYAPVLSPKEFDFLFQSVMKAKQLSDKVCFDFFFLLWDFNKQCTLAAFPSLVFLRGNHCSS